MIIPTINAQDLGFSGFGRGDKTHAVGHCRVRAQCLPGAAIEEAPMACFIQNDDDGPTVGVYIGLYESERDSTDHNNFRQYAIIPREDDRNDDILQLLGLLDSVNVLVQGSYSVAHMDRVLVKNYNAVRVV